MNARSWSDYARRTLKMCMLNLISQAMGRETEGANSGVQDTRKGSDPVLTNRNHTNGSSQAAGQTSPGKVDNSILIYI